MSIWDEYLVVERLAPGVVRIMRSSHRGDGPVGDTAVWVSAKTRKPCQDAATGAEIPTGSVCYRPVGNQMYRAERLLAAYVDSTMEGMTVA